MISLVRRSPLKSASQNAGARLASVRVTEPPRSYPMRMRVSRAISQFAQEHCSEHFEGIGWFLGKIAKRIMPYPTGPSVVPTTLGFPMLVDPCFDPVLETALYYHGIYEAGTLRVMQQVLRPGDTFIDIGANLGLMTLVAAQAVGPSGRVHAFEPLPEISAVLERNITLSRLRNVTLHRQALGATPERRTLYARTDVSRGGASFVKPVKDLGETTVDVDTLDHVIERSQIGPARMLKIDIEGWELEALKGAQRFLTQPGAPVLCVEYSTLPPISRGEALALYEFIRSIGYLVYALEKGKKRISKLQRIASTADLPRHDNLFCFTQDHLRDLHGALFKGRT